MNPLPPDWESGQATKKASRAAFLDTSLSFNCFSVSDYDLSPVGQPPTGSGAGVRLLIPIKGSLAVGGDAYLFLRDSDYTLVDSATGGERIQHVQQRNPQARIYIALNQ